jgi:hypothetical protein
MEKKVVDLCSQARELIHIFTSTYCLLENTFNRTIPSHWKPAFHSATFGTTVCSKFPCFPPLLPSLFYSHRSQSTSDWCTLLPPILLKNTIVEAYAPGERIGWGFLTPIQVHANSEDFRPNPAHCNVFTNFVPSLHLFETFFSPPRNLLQATMYYFNAVLIVFAGRAYTVVVN